MKNKLFQIFCVSVICFMTAIIGFAQDDRTLSSAAGDLYVISAKAGVVNYVEGRVSIQRENGKSGYLVKGDNIEVGDVVSTTANSRAEVLLNPGSFIRLDQNSEFGFLTTSLDDLKLKVNRGSAIFEVFASDDFKVSVTTPRGNFYLVDTGVYRVDVSPDGIAKIEVRNGKAQAGNLSGDTIKKGRTATINGSEIAISKFDRGEEDAFEDWSKSRAKLIAKANKKLAEDRLRNSLLSNARNNRIDCFNSFGLWVFNRSYNSYSFLPYGLGWRSPYGYGLGTSTGICNYPYRYRNYRPWYPSNGGNGGNGGGGAGNPPTTTVPAENVSRATRNSTPPFRRMENSGNAPVRTQSNRGSFPNFPSSTGTTRSTGRSSTTTTSTTTSAPSPSTKQPSTTILRPSRRGDN